MGRRKAEDGERLTGHSTFDASTTPEYVERIENLQAEIEEIMQAAKDKCAPLREDMKEVKKEATEAGFPRKELNDKIRERKLRAKADAIRDNLTPEQQDNFDKMSQALGDLDGTELGRAARKREAEEADRATAH